MSAQLYLGARPASRGCLSCSPKRLPDLSRFSPYCISPCGSHQPLKQMSSDLFQRATENLILPPPHCMKREKRGPRFYRGQTYTQNESPSGDALASIFLPHPSRPWNDVPRETNLCSLCYYRY